MNKKIVIVGAGVAGVNAATKLKELSNPIKYINFIFIFT